MLCLLLIKHDGGPLFYLIIRLDSLGLRCVGGVVTWIAILFLIVFDLCVFCL